MPSKHFTMTSNFGFDIERENRIFDFAEASLNLYKLWFMVSTYFRKAAGHFIAMLSLVFAVGLFFIVMPLLFILLFALSLGLIYSIVFWIYQDKNGYKSLTKIDRKDLIDLHVKMRHTVKRMETLRSSDLLFGAPILGHLMRTYFTHLSTAEKLVKAKAYPNYNVTPKNAKIHPYNPSDPWQQDMSDIRRFPQDLPIN